MASYSTYPNLNALRAELSWTHYRLIMLIDFSMKRSFYEIECANNNWSTRELDRQINSLLFERLALAGRFKRIIAKQFERATLKGADKIIVINKGKIRHKKG